jgi:hypothetical protein
MLTLPMLNIQILFTNYDIITEFLNLAFCSEHFISIKHRILAVFNINKKFNSDSLCAFNIIMAVGFTAMENWRDPMTCCKSQTNFYHIM